MNSGALLPAIALLAPAQEVDRDLRLALDDLSAKASALVETVNALEQKAKDNGQTLHPDLIEQRALVQSSIIRAEEALRDKDNTALRERLTRARGHIERLGKML
jgi:hypothetical protein